MRKVLVLLAVLALSPSYPAPAQAEGLQHDAEYYILKKQNGE